MWGRATSFGSGSWGLPPPWRTSEPIRDTEQLLRDRGLVEVHALAYDPLAAGLEDEERAHAAPEASSGRSHPSQLALVGAEQIELGDNDIVGVGQHDVLVALVREG